jgi:NAD(P)-dependent dehydrogenase (short-subunit alcohol dehydrogenase family)
MTKQLVGRNVVVTGASRGIGAGLAERLCAEGANVALTARTLTQHDRLAGSLTETANRCRVYGTRVITIAADLADAVSSATANTAAGPPFRTAGSSLAIGGYGASKAALNRETNALAAELYGVAIRVNTIEPRAAVMTEGAEALIGGTVGDDLIESLEAMVEATLYLCSCPIEQTGQVLQSLDLLDELGLTVMALDGRAPYPGGQRVWRG